MKLFDILFLDFILLVFPFLVYLMFNSIIKMHNLKKNDLYLSVAIFSSFYLLNKIGIISNITIIYLDLLVIFSYINNKKICAILLSMILIIYYSNFLNIWMYILIIEYSLYFILSWLIKNKYILLNSLIIVKILFYIRYSYVILVYLFIANIFIYFYDFLDNFLDYHINMKDIAKEKQMYTSLFKITHEIKNPIAVLKGYLDMFDVNDINHYKKYIPILKNEIDRLLVLLNDFLSISKLSIEKEEMDLVMLLEDVKACLKPIMTNKKIKFIMNINEEEIYMNADYNRLKQTIINILKNSYEAIDNKGKIELSLKLNKNIVKIIIKDNGIGIKKEELKQIKEAFFTTKDKGTGLGIYLSNEIIKRHNGKLEYKSNINEGTTVTVTLPLNA